MLNRKVLSRLLVASIIIVAIGLIMWVTPREAVAQCEDPKPSCSTCHAEAQPVFEQGEWHAIHARQEGCRSCHGGNDQAQDKESAHVGITLNPLEDTYTSCHACHPDDYRQRAERFAVVLHVTPMSSEPIARAVALQPPSEQSVARQPVTAAPSAATDQTPWLMVLVVVVAALLMGVAVIWRRLARQS
jgi:hypothetical protein